MMTKEESEANLREAILLHAEAFGIMGQNEMLYDFAIIAAWQPMEDRGETGYTTQFPRPNSPTHICAGLFRMGERLCFQQSEE